jgi:hypothetical protein
VKLSSNPRLAGVGLIVVLSLGAWAWALLRPLAEVAPGEGANVLASPSSLQPEHPTPAPVAGVSPAPVPVVPPESAESSPENPPSEPTWQATVAVREEEPAEPRETYPRMRETDSLELNPYPSAVDAHIEVTGQRMQAIATALELDDSAGRALTGIMAEHVRAERNLWDQAKDSGYSYVDEQELERVDQRTLESIRRSPALGDGMANVFERILVVMARDPGRANDPNQNVSFGITELRSIARGE